MGSTDLMPSGPPGVEKPGLETPGEKIFTVSEVNRLARECLEKISVTVQGEISGLNTGYRYYVYLDLRDENASLPALLTQRQCAALDFKLEEGASVLVSGILSIYERQGKYQIKVDKIRPFGEGDIRRRIEALKRKLHREGLFSDALKKPLPPFPEIIGVVTSTRGAAVRDVVVTIARRFPPARVLIRGVRVQGTGAVEQICEALDFFDEMLEVELVLLARGGGSLQDLEPFNDEAVARAIAGMRIPVITGVGHEPDVTIADLVADHRASTPTGAAEAAVPDRMEVQSLLDKTKLVIRRNITGDIQDLGRRLFALSSRPLYRGPDFLLGPLMQRWEKASSSLPESPRRGLARSKSRLAVLSNRPIFRRYDVLLSENRAQLKEATTGFVRGGRLLVERNRNKLERFEAKIGTLSPLSVLERGYSITFNRRTGGVIRSSDEVETGSPLRIRLARGTLEADVTGKE